MVNDKLSTKVLEEYLVFAELNKKLEKNVVIFNFQVLI